MASGEDLQKKWAKKEIRKTRLERLGNILLEGKGRKARERRTLEREVGSGPARS